MHEHINEYNEGQRDTWIDDNMTELIKGYIEEVTEDFNMYCEEQYSLENE